MLHKLDLLSIALLELSEVQDDLSSHSFINALHYYKNHHLGAASAAGNSPPQSAMSNFWSRRVTAERVTAVSLVSWRISLPSLRPHWKVYSWPSQIHKHQQQSLTSAIVGGPLSWETFSKCLQLYPFTAQQHPLPAPRGLPSPASPERAICIPLHCCCCNVTHRLLIPLYPLSFG